MLSVRYTNWICCGILVLSGCLILSDGAEEGPSMKRARAPAAPKPPLEAPQPLEGTDDDSRDDNRDEDSGEGSHDPLFGRPPPSFLSPSVHEYLELGKSIPGRPGTDYPILAAVPYTNFYCDEQKYPGFFADPETRCQGWHYCDIDGRQASFLCPNGTQFSQAFFVCDWWFNVRCELSARLYALNARLYQRPKLDPTRPHRTVTDELLKNIFLKK